jgi:hypothetical protein
VLLADVTYRQVDYWCRVGLLTPSIRDASGSGIARLFTPEDALVARLVKVLVASHLDHDVIHRAKALDLARPFLWVQGDVVGVGDTWDLVDAMAHVQATVVVNLSTLRAGI